MFRDDLSRGDDGWSPFAVKKKTVENQPKTDTDGAREISPITIMSSHDRIMIQQVGKPEAEEVEPVADADPKDSSVTSSVSDSEPDSDENGSLQIPIPNPIHPSSLPPEPEDPVSVVKAPSPILGALMPLTSPGPS